MKPPGSAPDRLERPFFDRPVLEVARDLLGRVLEHHGEAGTVAVRLSEVEAYSGQGMDPGSHAHRGRTPRNAVMFGPGGHAYVYFTYGMHWCANVVCGPEGVASGVLLRGGSVLHGHGLARQRRPAARAERDLTRGPARLAAALGIDGRCNGADLCAAEAQLLLRAGTPVPDELVRTGPRVGVAGQGAAIRWRYWVADDRTVSDYRAAVPRPPRTRASGRLGTDGSAPGAVEERSAARRSEHRRRPDAP